jgi:hypothetical protein
MLTRLLAVVYLETRDIGSWIVEGNAVDAVRVEIGWNRAGT